MGGEEPVEIVFAPGVDEVVHAAVLRHITGSTPTDEAIDDRPLPERRGRRAVARMIRAYRSRVSPRLGDRCVFEPSCSRYAEAVVADHGVVRGTVLAASRLRRCRPGAGGIDLPPDPVQPT